MERSRAKQAKAKIKQNVSKLKPKHIAIGITAIIAIIIGLITIINSKVEPFEFSTIIMVSDDIEELDPEVWSVSNSNVNISKAELRNDVGFASYQLVVSFTKPGETVVTLSNLDGQKYTYKVSVDKNKKVELGT